MWSLQDTTHKRCYLWLLNRPMTFPIEMKESISPYHFSSGNLSEQNLIWRAFLQANYKVIKTWKYLCRTPLAQWAITVYQHFSLLQNVFWSLFYDLARIQTTFSKFQVHFLFSLIYDPCLSNSKNAVITLTFKAFLNNGCWQFRRIFHQAQQVIVLPATFFVSKELSHLKCVNHHFSSLFRQNLKYELELKVTIPASRGIWKHHWKPQDSRFKHMVGDHWKAQRQRGGK